MVPVLRVQAMILIHSVDGLYVLSWDYLRLKQANSIIKYN